MIVTCRSVLRGLGTGALVTTASSLFGSQLRGTPVVTAYPFALGVASGDPAPDGLVLWTKIAPKPLEQRGGIPKWAIEVEWAVGADARMRQVVQKGTMVAHPELGHAVHVEVGGLH